MGKLACWLFVGFVMFVGLAYFHNVVEPTNTLDVSMKQFSNDPAVAHEMRSQNFVYNHIDQWLIGTWLFVGIVLFSKEMLMIAKKLFPCCLALMLLSLTGCWKPYQPVTLETVETSETAFLLPMVENTERQEIFQSEKYLEKNMLAAKEVQIPYRWVATGYETWGPNGKWVPSAKLIKVDRAPVTREWTADEKSGTSKQNEAIWVMTSDSVAFSTGWTCTARIATAQDAVKFLFNYPNGSLADVMDKEIRSKIQTAFGLEVTDRQMDELRKSATPIFKRVESEVKEFFLNRGITITNLGISGGYVYQDPRIQDTLNKVFQAQQDQLTAQAERDAQEERNKTVKLTAEGLADAARAKATGDADAIKLVADAKAYEMKLAQENLELYMGLKRMDLEKQRLQQWNGQFPVYFMGTSGNGPEMLLQMPAMPQPTPLLKK